jgi:hypothetical protein
MRSCDDYKRILRLWEEGYNKSEIERQTGIPRPTVRDCIKKYGSLAQLDDHLALHQQPLLFQVLTGKIAGDHEQLLKAYAYLLGLYLGDGNIVKMPRTYRMRITLDARYPNIIQACAQAGKTLLPENQGGLAKRFHEGHLSCVDVSIYHKDLPLFFPQHGAGHKHERKIELEDWQQQIVDTYPIEFLRGLYHSDGSRFSNIVNGKDYPRYQFTNYSDDIRKIFCDTYDRLGVHWTTKQRTGLHESDIFISKRKDVEFLDGVIGRKS